MCEYIILRYIYVHIGIKKFRRLKGKASSVIYDNVSFSRINMGKQIVLTRSSIAIHPRKSPVVCYELINFPFSNNGASMNLDRQDSSRLISQG